MAWRETRASWARLLFFFLSVALGVAAVVLLRSVVQNVRTTLTGEARALVGADLVLQSPRPWTAEQVADAAAVIGPDDLLDETAMVDTQTMARGVEGRGTGLVRLVELRGVEAAFPFYGRLELEGGLTYAHQRLAGRGALVQRDLLVDLGLDVGETLVLAGQPFEIRGVVSRDRVQQGSGIAFGPRVYVDLADLRKTTLLGPGSRATHARMLRVPEDRVLPLVEALRERFRQATIGVRSWRTLEDRLGRSLRTAENYLSLVGFAVVVLGGIGVWSVTRVIVQQKIKSVAILKCVGAASGQVLAIYVLQVTAMALVGSSLGVALARAGAAAIPARVLTALDVGAVTITLSAAAQGVAVGVLVSVLFALVPLLEMRGVKPLLLLRADTADQSRARDWRSVGAGVVVGGLLVVVAMWQAGSVLAGLYVSGGLGGVALVLWAASRLLVRLVRPLTRVRGFAVRHATLGLGRPGNQTRVILMAVGLGSFFILGVRALQGNLLAEFNDELGQNWPDLVLIDVQKDQVDDVRRVAGAFARTTPSLVPQLRARVTAVDGARVTLPTREAVREHGRLGREFSLTYRSDLQPNEVVSAGQFWSTPLPGLTTPDGADTEVSISHDVEEDVGVQIGDLISFDVAGRPVRARVTSVRHVEWNDEQNGGFVFVLRPGPAVDRTPHAFMGFVQLSPDGRARGDLQRQLVTAHPNVTIIDVRDVLGRVQEIIGNASLAITVVGAVTLVAGVLILVGAVAMTKFQRLYETAIYRALGASTRLVVTLTAIEYGLLGLLAGTLGGLGALALSWSLARFLFEIEWRPAPGLLTGGALATAVAVSLVGVLASVDLLLRKPLGTLRDP